MPNERNRDTNEELLILALDTDEGVNEWAITELLDRLEAAEEILRQLYRSDMVFDKYQSQHFRNLARLYFMERKTND